MTAQEAKKLADESFEGSYFDSAMDEIYSRIKDKCLKGNKYVYVDIKDPRLGIRIWQKLLDDGYDVRKTLSEKKHSSSRFSYDRDIIGLAIAWYELNAPKV